MLRPVIANNSFYCSVGRESDFIDFSPRWIDFLGLGQVDILSKKFSDFIYEDDTSTWKQALDQSVQQRFPYEVDIRVCGKDPEPMLITFSILYLSRESRFIIFADDSSDIREKLRRQNSAKRLSAEVYGAGYWEYNLKTGHFFAELSDRVNNETFTIDQFIEYFKLLHDSSEYDHIEIAFKHIFDSTRRIEFTLKCHENSYNKFVVNEISNLIWLQELL